jgi:hypothetical protein
MFYIISTVHQLSLSIQFEQNTLSWIQFACAVSHIMGRNDPSHFQTDMICYFARSSEWIMACVLFIGEKVAWRNLTQPAWSFKNACFPMKSCLSCSAYVGPLELNLQFVFLVILVFHVSSLTLQSVIPAAVPSSMARSNIWQWMADTLHFRTSPWQSVTLRNKGRKSKLRKWLWYRFWTISEPATAHVPVWKHFMKGFKRLEKWDQMAPDFFSHCPCLYILQPATFPDLCCC